MRILHLTLKKKWFDMIASGGKIEEYRDIKPYWCSRLLFRIPVPWGGYLSPFSDILKEDYDFKSWKNFTGGAPVFEKFIGVLFVNGYKSDSRKIYFKLESIHIGEGKYEWGAEPGKKYFVIKFSKLL